MDGVLGLDFLRYSSNILQTPEKSKEYSTFLVKMVKKNFYSVRQFMFGHYPTVK